MHTDTMVDGEVKYIYMHSTGVAAVNPYGSS